MIKLHNTLTRQKEIFTPQDPDHIKMYVCGPTVYDRAHLGNARPVVVFDVLYRLLKSFYPKVTYVRNITDIDDKINKRAREKGVSLSEITGPMIALFHQDMAALHTLAPDIEPRATDHILEIIYMIQSLIDKGHAYKAEGHVLFRTQSFPTYGCLSRHHREDILAGARVDIAPYKEDAADFILWKPSDELTPGWDSPWGRGRPGWHIECSAMSQKHLGLPFDIHGGGQDLIFPHHENEIAQSTAAGGGCAHYWIHNGIITIGGSKMSKSLGNFIDLDVLLKDYPGEAIRYALLNSHYRQPLDWTESTPVQAKKSLDRLYGALLHSISSSRDQNPVENDLNTTTPVFEALQDDLNTPTALAELHNLASKINKAVLEKERYRKQLLAGGQALGLFNCDPVAWFQGSFSNRSSSDSSYIEDLLKQREKARLHQDFRTADAIRKKLNDLNIIIEDTKKGPNWRKAF